MGKVKIPIAGNCIHLQNIFGWHLNLAGLHNLQADTRLQEEGMDTGEWWWRHRQLDDAFHYSVSLGKLEPFLTADVF